MKLLKAFLIAMLPLFIMQSCGSGTKEKAKKQVLNLNFSSEPASLDPRQANYSIYTNIFPFLFDGLMRFNPKGELVPSVAKDVAVSEDGKTYTFYLRSSKWSNGDPVTAQDFEYAWKWTLNPKNPTPLASHLYCIKNGEMVNQGKIPPSKLGVYAKDSETLVVELEQPLPFFPELTSTYNFFPVNHRDPNSFDRGEVISNGPFILDTWNPHQEMHLKQNKRYWDKESVSIKAVKIVFVEDMNTELHLFHSGELDWSGAPLSLGLPMDAFPQLKSQDLLHTYRVLSTYFYSFNTERFPLYNRKIRQALSYSIPREEIIEHITQGSEYPAYHFVPAQISYAMLSNTPYSKKQIQQLFNEGLSELGITRSSFPPIQISYNTSETHHSIAQAIQNQWKQWLGVEVKLKNQDWKSHLSEVSAGNFDVARLSWKGMSSDPINFLEIFKDQYHPMHRSGWRHDRFKRNINLSTSTAQLDERLFYLAEAEEILTDQMPVAPIFFGTVSYVKHPLLKNYYITQLGTIDFKWASFTDEE